MATPHDIYHMPALRRTLDIYDMFLSHFVPEVGDAQFDDLIKYQTELEMRTVFEYCDPEDFHHKYFWEMNTYWYEQNPVMVTQRKHGGEYGAVYYHRFITNMPKYHTMVGHLQHYALPDTPLSIDLYTVHQEIEMLTNYDDCWKSTAHMRQACYMVGNDYDLDTTFIKELRFAEA